MALKEFELREQLYMNMKLVREYIRQIKFIMYNKYIPKKAIWLIVKDTLIDDLVKIIGDNERVGELGKSVNITIEILKALANLNNKIWKKVLDAARDLEEMFLIVKSEFLAILSDFIGYYGHNEKADIAVERLRGKGNPSINIQDLENIQKTIDQMERLMPGNKLMRLFGFRV